MFMLISPVADQKPLVMLRLILFASNSCHTITFLLSKYFKNRICNLELAQLAIRKEPKMCSGEIYLFLCVMLSCLIALQHASDCGVQHYHFQGYRYERRARASSKIVGGSKTFLGEFPWLAMIFYSKSEKNECGGAIINNEFILTAAHCLSGTILNVAGQP